MKCWIFCAFLGNIKMAYFLVALTITLLGAYQKINYQVRAHIAIKQEMMD